MTPENQKMLQSLADKFGVTVQYLWAVLVHGQRIEGIFNALMVAVLTAFLYASYRMLRKFFVDDADDGWLMGGCIVGGISAVLFCICAYTAAIDLFAPEYAALMTILGKIK